MPGILERRPPLFPDLVDWFETGLARFPARRGIGVHGIRVEEQLSEAAYCLRAELPGLDVDKDIEIDIQHGVLSLRAERSEETRQRHHSEFRYGSFARSVRLPQGAKENEAKAEYKDGILTITVPLTVAEKSPVTHVEVSRAE
ncbi:Hsp20/alpha crystallin family protein [Streptomyces sp. S.PB5]|uniref:Hsp20/alpha crystallin family protein n=1 Tax=Streptomyces sp. S.PB5 TaxID=3020844 RepID=UPI0025AF46CF|nr:Hsp20/alpha crystallin family protein [Streptomyces sp. S.PB5]MDN3029000.1 Hsp20/alpha crystallin family protein [Streptomyces sp. S.PB5]